MKSNDNKPALSYLGLYDWSKSAFDGFGRIIMAKHYNYDDKIDWYKNNIKNLIKSLNIKIKKTKDYDRKEDLKNLLYRVEVLNDFLNKHI